MTKQLIREIGNVFGVHLSSAEISAAEADDMAGALPRIMPGDAKKLAGQLMVLLCTSTNPIPYSTRLDHLIYYLDGKMQKGRESDLAYAGLKEMALRGYTKAEARVVLEWLCKIGRPRFDRLCGDDVESAISYWKERIGPE